MRSPSCLLSFVLSFVVGLAQPASAQPVSAPVIQNVTVNADTNVITITGTGLGPDVLVTVDSQAATLLPGATSARVEVQAPANLLTTPGTYRLTVVDPVRRVGDNFVVASHGGVVSGSVPVSAVPSPAEAPARSSAAARTQALGSTGTSGPSHSTAGPSPLVIENPGFPYLTAIGTLA